MVSEVPSLKWGSVMELAVTIEVSTQKDLALI